MLSIAKITKLARSERFEPLLDEVCRNGRPRVGPAPLISATREYATTPGALPMAALGLGLRRAVELSWTISPDVVEVADILGQRVCQLAALRCRSAKAVPFPDKLREALGHGVTGLAELVKHCEQTHAEIEESAWKRLNAALQIGRFMLEGEAVFMTPQRAVQLTTRRSDDDSMAA